MSNYSETWFTLECPQCRSKNWFYGGHSEDIVGRRVPEDIVGCWKCKHKWLMMDDDQTMVNIFCEERGILQGIDADTESIEEMRKNGQIEFDTVQEFLDQYELLSWEIGKNLVEIRKND